MSVDLSGGYERLPADTLRRVDELCDRFEQQRDAGNQPRIEDVLEEVTESEQSVLLRFLIQSELEHRCRNASRPAVEEYQARFPRHRALVTDEFAKFPWGDVVDTYAPQAATSDHELVDPVRKGLDRPAQLSGRYAIEGKIGSGGNAMVLLAVDQELGRQVAIKVPRSDQQLDSDFYIHEAQTAAQLTHPAIVQVHDVGRDQQGLPFVVMQYIDGQSLAEHLNTDRPAPTRTAQLLAQIADAVQYAHQQGFVHRDLKPANILLDHEGNPFVSDFGLALHERVQAQYRGDSSGTPLYRSPEQVRGEADWMDGRCDVWSLGIILYEMLTGRRPFRTSEEIQFRSPKPPRQVDDKVPESLERICLKCLSKAVDNRYATADALANDLRSTVAALVAEEICLGEGTDSSSLLSRRNNIIVIQTTAPVDEAKSRGSDPIGPNPYKGLFAFGESDADRFFGREDLTERLSRLFRTLHEDTRPEKARVRLLPVVGPSGCGKSSLVRAGLIARLARNPLTDWQDIRVIVFQPGSRPLESLAIAFARLMTRDTSLLTKSSELQKILRQSHDGQYEGLRQIAATLSDSRCSPLIVFVDQIDEVYSLSDQAEERDIFIQNLLVAARDVGGPVSVILTLRSDFLGETQDHPRLNTLISEQGVIVPAMTKEQLRAAIAEPANAAGHPLDAACIDLLIEQTLGREGALPLLQFALVRIWEGLAQGVEPAETLKRLGGVGGALSGEAQGIFESLDHDDQEVVRRVFLSLVQLSQGSPDSRRRVQVRWLVTHGEDPARVREVIRRFSTPGARLLTLSAGPDGTETVEVTHEAIFDNWKLLRRWLDESREDIQFQRRLDEAARHWAKEQKPDGLLWRSPDLDRLLEFQRRNEREMTPAQLEFSSRSTERVEDQHRRQRRRMRLYQSAAVVFALMAGVAVYVGQRARRYQQEAIALEQEARHHALEATQASERAQREAKRSRQWSYLSDMSFAAEAWKNADILLLNDLLDRHRPRPEEDDLRGFEWYYLWHQSHSALHTFLPDMSVNTVCFLPDGKSIAAGFGPFVKLSQDAHRISMWDLAIGEERPESASLSGWTLGFSPDGSKAAMPRGGDSVVTVDLTTGMDELTFHLDRPEDSRVYFSRDNSFALSVTQMTEGVQLRGWDLRTGKQTIHKTLVPTLAVSCGTFSPDGRIIALGGLMRTESRGFIRLYDARTLGELAKLDGHDRRISSLAFSPDGRTLASGSLDKTIKLWTWPNGREPMTLRGHTNWIRDVEFRPPNGKTLASASQDGTIVLWDVASGRRNDSLKGHAGYVWDVAFSPDGDRLCSCGTTIKVWDLASNKPSNLLTGHRGEVFQVDFSPDGRILASGEANGTVTLWDVATGHQAASWAAHPGYPVVCVAFSPDGAALATAGGNADAVIKLWDAATHQPAGSPLKGHTSSIWDLAFSPNGRNLATVDDDRQVRIWDIPSRKAIKSLTAAHVPVSVAFSLDGSILATGGNGSIQLWETASWRELNPIETPSQTNRVAFSQKGMLAIGGGRHIELYDATALDNATAAAPLISIKPQSPWIFSLAFSPDGKILVSVGGDNRVTLWDAATGRPRATFGDHTEPVYGVAFSPDGQTLATGSLDRTVRLWRAPREEEVQAAAGSQ